VTPHVFRAAAAADVERAYAWYEQQRAGLGEEFLVAVGQTVNDVLDAPERRPVVHRYTRRALVPRFPYGLYYRVVNDTVVFVACFHTRRDPAGWKRRR